jgi:Leucine-rich repeat (LRR) protein
LIGSYDCGSCGSHPEIIPHDCTCNELVISCEGSGELPLKKFFRYLSENTGDSRKSFQKFVLTNTFITTLEENTFADITFDTIELVGATNLLSIHRGAFEITNQFIKTFTAKDTSLSSCMKTDCQDFELFSALSSLTNLENLTITNSKITHIPEKAFHSLNGDFKNLKTIDLSSNKIQKIGDNAFSRLPSLTNLSLTGNAIDAIYDKSFAFDTLSKDVIRIDLSNNKIDSLSNGGFGLRSFKDLKRPAIIDLRKNNNLKVLNATVFKEFIDLKSQNRIEIEELDCQNCDNYWLVTYNEQLDTIKCANKIAIKSIDNFKNCKKER